MSSNLISGRMPAGISEDILATLVIVHLIGLHEDRSNNPIGVRSDIDKVPFHHYYSLKDFHGAVIFAILLCVMAFLFPYSLGTQRISNQPIH